MNPLRSLFFPPLAKKALLVRLCRPNCLHQSKQQGGAPGTTTEVPSSFLRKFTIVTRADTFTYYTRPCPVPLQESSPTIRRGSLSGKGAISFPFFGLLFLIITLFTSFSREQHTKINNKKYGTRNKHHRSCVPGAVFSLPWKHFRQFQRTAQQQQQIALWRTRDTLQQTRE